MVQGDNLDALKALLPFYAGQVQCIYIDPPFDVGADFSMDIQIGGDTFTKKPNILEGPPYAQSRNLMGL